MLQLGMYDCALTSCRAWLLMCFAPKYAIVLIAQQSILNLTISFCRDTCNCVITLYESENYRGRSLVVREQNAQMSVDNFQDIASSAKVKGGCCWILYEHPDFDGRSYIVDPGNYPSSQSWGGPGNQLSSLRVLPPRGTSAIVLFEHPNFNGRMVVFYGSHSNLVNQAFNDKTSSFIITGTNSWTLYEHSDYMGNSRTFQPGHYSSGVPGIGNDELTSFRKN